MKKRSKSRASMRDQIRGVGGFVRELSAEVDTKAIRKVLDEDAPRAFRKLAGQRQGQPSENGLRHALITARDVLRGIAQRLSPGRRALFLIAMILPFLTLLTFEFGDKDQIAVDASPIFLIASIFTLTVLLGMELVDRARVRDELEAARALQRDLLPQRVEPPPGWQIVHRAETANEVGGDYHDFLPLPDGRLVIVVGDASGHGLAAGLLMAIAKATLAAALDVDPSPTAALAYLNRILVRTGGSRAFMSMFYGVLDPESGKLDYACAGHPFPIHRHTNGQLEELGHGALPLGLKRGQEWRTASAQIGKGELLVLFSDGLVEASHPESGEAFGFERVNRLVFMGGHPITVQTNLWAALQAHRASESLEDDATIIVIGRDP